MTEVARQLPARQLPARPARALVFAALVSLVTLALLVTAYLLANFAPGPWWFALCLAIPLTIGLPTTVAFTACVSVWPGPPLWLFGVLSVVVGFTFQASAHSLLRRLRRKSA